MQPHDQEVKAPVVQMNEREANERETSVPSLAEIAAATEIKFSDEDRSLIRETFARGVPEVEFRQLLRIAELRGLSPFLGQCHFVKRWNKDQGKDIWSVQVSIDGMRGQAEASGVYDGQDEPEFTYDDKGNLLTAKVRVYRRDWRRPAVGLAHWGEHVQRTKDGRPTFMWDSKPHIMLGKCAEAAGLRKAFPLRLGKLYTDIETGVEPGKAPEDRRSSPGHDASRLEAQRDDIVRRAKQLGLTGEQLRSKMGKSVSEYTERDLGVAIGLLARIEHGESTVEQLFGVARPAPQASQAASPAPAQATSPEPDMTGEDEPFNVPEPLLFDELAGSISSSRTMEELAEASSFVQQACANDSISQEERDELADIYRIAKRRLGAGA